MIYNHEVAGSCPALATLIKGKLFLLLPFFYFWYMTHFVYILYSHSIDRHYIGSCSDIELRLSRHNAGATISTKSGRPWKVVYSEKFNSKTEAIKREIYLKRMKSRVFIESLIDKN